MILMPPTVKRVFGQLSVNGRILEPTPADKIIALVLVIGRFLLIIFRYASVDRVQFPVPDANFGIDRGIPDSLQTPRALG